MSKNASDEQIAGTIVMAILVLTVAAAVIIATALAAGVTEIGAVYREHAQEDAPHRSLLLGVLGGLAGIALGLGVLAVAVPSAMVACIVTGAWVLLAYVAIVEGVDYAGRRQLKDGGNVASYLDFSQDAGATERNRVALP